MFNKNINTNLCWYLLLFVMSIDLIRSQQFINNGFSVDPFLELNSATTIGKTTKSNNICVSNGALAGAIIGTIILCIFIGFLVWLTYLRPKFQELREKLNSSSSKTPPINYKFETSATSQLPLDVTDYKFGTFPFRQSQILSVHNQSNRFGSSFRSVNMDQDSEMLDVELLEPTFGGLNFSITGNMRAGIFIKEVLHKGPQTSKAANLLKTGDRIVALTISFQSIVYEDALTILSYASPYPVILRIQRSLNHQKINERRNTVKWRDDFEHYDHDTSIQSKKSTRQLKKGNQKKISSNKNSSITSKKSRIKTTNQISTVKSVTNAVISYLHYKGSASAIEQSTEPVNSQDPTTMPYYDSPYDYYYGGQISQYQYLHQSQLNKNNNNSLSADTLTTVTPNLAKSVYTLELTSKKLSLPNAVRRCERRLSSPAIISSVIMENIDTFV